MTQRVDPTQSKYKNYRPACVKCNHYKPAKNSDPFDIETQCAIYGNIPKDYLLMADACSELAIENKNALIDVGDRPLTLIERFAADF